MKCVLQLTIFCVLLLATQATPFGPRYANFAQHSTYGSTQYGTPYNQSTYGGSQYPSYGSNQQRPGNQGTFGSYPNNYQQPLNTYNQSRLGNQGAFGGVGTTQWNRTGSIGTWSPNKPVIAPPPGSSWNQTRTGLNVGGIQPGRQWNQYNQTIPGSQTPYGPGSNYPGGIGGSYPPGTGSSYPSGSTGRYPSGTGSSYPSYGGSSYPPAYNGSYSPGIGSPYPSGTGSNYPAYGGTSGQQPYNRGSSFATPVGQQTQEFLNCLSTCQRNYENSPVCGNNQRTYPNLSHLQCEQRCGAGVQFSHNGQCPMGK